MKVAEMPPAAPQATMIRSRLSGVRTHCPMPEASAEPICTIGPLTTALGLLVAAAGEAYGVSAVGPVPL